MTGQKLTIQDIKSKYPEEKRGFEKASNLWGYLVFRRISPYPASLFLALGISANKVTCISFIAELASFGFFIIGNYRSAVIGAILMNVWALLDYVDGDVARCTNSCSRYGEFLDSLGSSIGGLLFASIGIGLFNHPDSGMNLLASYFPSLDIRGIFLFLGTWASLFFILPSFIGGELGRLFHVKLNDVMAQRKTALYYPEKIAWNLISLSGVLMPLLLLAAILRFSSIIVLAYALITTCFFVASLILLLKKAASLER